MKAHARIVLALCAAMLFHTAVQAGEYKRWVVDSTDLNGGATSHEVGSLPAVRNFVVTAGGVIGAGVSGEATYGGLAHADASGQMQFNYTGDSWNV